MPDSGSVSCSLVGGESMAARQHTGSRIVRYATARSRRRCDSYSVQPHCRNDRTYSVPVQKGRKFFDIPYDNTVPET